MTKHFKKRDGSRMPAGTGERPVVAVVGRPNVGKSTLFNRLARKKLAIVHDEPGVTRDRHYADTDAFGRPYTLVDTGGFDPEDEDPMRSGIAQHVRDAIKDADAIIFVIDAKSSLQHADKAAIHLLRKAGKPAYFVANKADSPKDDPGAYELFQEGVKEIFYVSALHGRGIGDLEAALVKDFPKADLDPISHEGLTRVAIVGKPNAGKSSLLNRILGENRMLVDSRPGTTRDAIDSLVTRGETSYVLVDTAGIRRKGKVFKAEDPVESASVLHSIRSIENAHIAVVVCDADEGVSEQDAKILGLAADRFRGLIVALNKCDLLSKDEIDKAIEKARDKLTFAQYAAIVPLSAKTGRGIPELFRTIDAVKGEFDKRVTTGQLNRFFAEVLELRPPPTMGGRAPRITYITQAESSPPTFVAMSNAPDNIHFSYRRFVINRLRKSFGFEGVPVRLHFREKRSGKKKGDTSTDE